MLRPQSVAMAPWPAHDCRAPRLTRWAKDPGEEVAALGGGPLTAGSAQDVVEASASTIEAGQAYLGALDGSGP
jgi:hypothetical protein